MKRIILTIAISLSALAAAAQSKIGHVNMAKISDTIPSRKTAIADYQLIAGRSMRDIQGRDSVLQIQYQSYMQQEASLPATTKQYMQNELQKQNNQLQQDQQIFEQEMMKLEQDMVNKYTEMVKAAVKVVADAKKLNYVIDDTMTLYSENGVNITNEVIREVLILDAKK